MEDRDDPEIYAVISNAEGQALIWPADRELPVEWQVDGMRGSKQECLDFVAITWMGMRPQSLRAKMEGMG